jgi:hypothetical protein
MEMGNLNFFLGKVLRLTALFKGFKVILICERVNRGLFLLSNNRHISDIVLIIHNVSNLIDCKVNHCILRMKIKFICIFILIYDYLKKK